MQDLYSINDDDLYSKSVDELVQRLEQMEKSNEQIKRENQLFDSHLIRKQLDNAPNQQEIEQRYK